MNSAPLIDYKEQRIQQLVDHLDTRLHTTQVMAELLLDFAALRDGADYSYLSRYREGALMDAMVHLSRSNYEDFCRLVELAKLPADQPRP
ncbi:hypothetical protein LJR232_001243 [Aquipseudomonas alcaligenes]|uniref:hypothetical protein n=1 Tax=Pseudomonas sp. zfem005 TaxID=3078200 RepID=UPI002927EF19|nr:hypothetical protein [Pseudomonas sp. zfem005]MDU9413270.1 hypothetical protein [Pseudomonas sp. zfem005]